jgi:hypothetical protein
MEMKMGRQLADEKPEAETSDFALFLEGFIRANIRYRCNDNILNFQEGQSSAILWQITNCVRRNLSLDGIAQLLSIL